MNDYIMLTIYSSIENYSTARLIDGSTIDSLLFQVKWTYALEQHQVSSITERWNYSDII